MGVSYILIRTGMIPMLKRRYLHVVNYMVIADERTT
jgi:hypothetical protein